MNRKKQKLSLELDNAENDLDEHITKIEKEVADKGAQLNLNNVLKEEEKEEIRRLEPELEKIGAQLNLDIEQLLKEHEQLLKEREQLKKLLKENEQLLEKKQALLTKTEDFEDRVITAKRKLADISNEVMKSNDATTNINSLPDEILLKIFGYIRQNKLAKHIARVCKRWNPLTRSPVLWKIVDVKLYVWEMKEVKMFLQTLPSRVSCIKLDFNAYMYIGLEHLDFEEFCVSLQEKCSHLQMLILCEARFSNSLASIIDLCSKFFQNVKRLVLYDCRLSDCPPTQEYSDVSKIEALDVIDCDECGSILPFSKMPCLRMLNLYFTEINESWFEDDTSFLNQLTVLNLGFTGIEHFSTLQTIFNHAVNLKELYLCNIHLSDSGVKFNNMVFPHLKTICLRSRWEVTCEDIISLIRSCPSLENVYVDDHVAESYAKHSFVVTNRCMLEIVKVNNFCDDHKKIDYLRVQSYRFRYKHS